MWSGLPIWGSPEGALSSRPVFVPADPVTRQEMASFLVRAFQLEQGTSNRFADVEAGNSHLADINGLATAGITAGCATEPALYCPTVATTRAQMATFLARALGIATVAPPEETTRLVEDTTQSRQDGDFAQVATSPAHACGVRIDHTLVCWGANWAGQAEPPEGEFVSVALGWAHSCGLRVDQTISCWGANWDGQAEPPEGKFASISAAGNHGCALRADGRIACWGRNDRGQIDVPDELFSAIAAGGSHTCGLRYIDHDLVCWGDNEYGQADPPERRLCQLSQLATWYSCGLKPDGVDHVLGGKRGGSRRRAGKAAHSSSCWLVAFLWNTHQSNCCVLGPRRVRKGRPSRGHVRFRHRERRVFVRDRHQRGSHLLGPNHA